MTRPVCAVLGIGPGNGAAFARRFARAGYQVALLARSKALSSELERELSGSRAYACDAGDAQSVERAFSAIRSDLGEVDVLIYNAGTGVWGNVEQITPEGFEQSWRINALGALLASQQVIPAMKQKQRGNIVFIGATASRRGAIRTAAFAPAKAAQRSLAESMAKHLGPAGIHVSLLIIDGVIDLPRTRTQMPNKPDTFFLRPDEIAETVHFITEQPRSAWSFEVDVRPFAEVW